MKTKDEEFTNIEISTILSHRTKEGKINFEITGPNGSAKTQWDIAKAKHIRDMLSEAIEAAISDELIYKFFVTKVGFDDRKASMVLLDFRDLRQGSKKTVDPN